MLIVRGQLLAWFSNETVGNHREESLGGIVRGSPAGIFQFDTAANLNPEGAQAASQAVARDSK